MMTNAQLYLAVGLPVFAILTSLIVSLVQISAIRDEIKTLRQDVSAQIAVGRDDVKAMREDIREIRSDIKLLTGKVYEMMGEKH